MARIPEVKGNEFQEQCFRRGPGQRTGRCGKRPALQVGKIKDKCAEGVVAHALFDEITQC